MKQLKLIIVVVIIATMPVYFLSGCTYEPARRYFQTNPNNTSNNESRGLPGNLVGSNNSGNRISATYEMVDFSYLGISSDSMTVRAGAGTNYPAIGTVRSGQKLRALGKMDGWYIVKIPDSGKIGCIKATGASPFGSSTGTTNTNFTTGTGTVTPFPNTGTSNAGMGNTATGNTNAGNATTGNTAAGNTTAGSGAMSADESRILQLVNAERVKTGARALTSSSECTKLARMKAQDMVNNNYFSHQSPTYGSPFDMLKSNNVSYMYAGENIAMNQTADAAFKAWMNSEGHRKNILNPNFTELGVGIAPKGNGSYIYTQLFIGR